MALRQPGCAMMDEVHLAWLAQCPTLTDAHAAAARAITPSCRRAPGERSLRHHAGFRYLAGDGVVSGALAARERT
jgi:hypothetical protein